MKNQTSHSGSTGSRPHAQESPRAFSGAAEGCGDDLEAASSAGAAPVDHARIERAVRESLLAVGEDPDREGLLQTPARVARMYAEMFSGLKADPAVHLRTAFTEKYDEVVLVRNIAFNSVCEHHLLPFMASASSPGWWRWFPTARKCRNG